MRFRRRAKIFPGVYLNFSKSGISTTIGMRGASINIGKQGTYLNTGIPGTGIYDRIKLSDNKPKHHDVPSSINTSTDDIHLIKSDNTESITSEGLLELKKTIIECYQERTEIKKEIAKAGSGIIFANIIFYLSYLLIIGFFVKYFKQNRKNHLDNLNELNNHLLNCCINIDLELEPQFETKYCELLENYKILISSQNIWDLTSQASSLSNISRSAASTSVSRRIIKLDFGNIDIIKSKHDALHFKTSSGGDLYIYPAFIAIVDADKKFGLIDIREIEFSFHSQKFVEEGIVPTDALIIDNTWLKVNKNGTPDRRFKFNRQIPVCQYGEMSFRSNTGLNEAYHFSCYEKSSQFAKCMSEYQAMIKI